VRWLGLLLRYKEKVTRDSACCARVFSWLAMAHSAATVEAALMHVSGGNAVHATVRRVGVQVLLLSLSYCSLFSSCIMHDNAPLQTQVACCAFFAPGCCSLLPGNRFRAYLLLSATLCCARSRR
jgi:hypothetical protein